MHTSSLLMADSAYVIARAETLNERLLIDLDKFSEIDARVPAYVRRIAIFAHRLMQMRLMHKWLSCCGSNGG